MSKQTFLLLGPENGEKKDFVKNQEKALISKFGETEKFRFYPYDTEISEIVSIMRNGSLFSSHKIVTINNCEDIKKKSAVDQLVEYLKSPSEDVTLFLLSDANKIDAKIEKVIKKENKKIFWELFENRKRDWVISFFRKRNLSIDPEAVELLLEMIDNNTDSMRNDCEKLAFYFKEGDRISEDDIENFLYHSREENVFTLFEKVCRRDLEASLDVLNSIVLARETQPVQLLSGLLWQFRNLLSLSTMLSRRVPQPEALLKSNIRGKKSQKTYLEGTRNFRIHELEKIITLTMDYDNRLRSVRTEMQDSVVEMYLYNCIRKMA
ncbi:DNA polymerase III subunit delta [Spirochaeta isovalerica]|uniref:DNA polymerase III subunit delta n=1 Tax=Spirochaeta isovalerica TaxID=150 RepID=A0A841RH16_9SPIO|nr:DNA polymerase III subunit delta [Spirochaeta isovalerica]MBB6482310.1 DNA polymerase-3 subunit delta [Spirochaeta isovalerica]